MTLRPEFTLGHSPYNPFLFAAVGFAPADGAVVNGDENADENGEVVTVLSALTRLKLDPWAEAARLASLPPDVAASALAATLAPLTSVAWEAGDAASTAERLVALLPAGSPADVPPAAARGQRPKSWLRWVLLFFAILFLALYLKPDNNLEPGQSSGFSVPQ